MAEVTERVWTSGPREAKRSAWGDTLQVNGKQIRRFNAVWSKDDVRDALAAAILARDAPEVTAAAVVMLGQLRIAASTTSARRASDRSRTIE